MALPPSPFRPCVLVCAASFRLGLTSARVAAHAGAMPKAQSRSQRHHRRKSKNLPVKTRVEQRRIPRIRQKGRDQVAPEKRHRESQHPTQRGEQQTLRKHLPQKPPAPRAQSQPHADLPMPGSGARQQHARNVGAGQQKHQANHRGQNHKRFPVLLLRKEQPAAAIRQRQPWQRLTSIHLVCRQHHCGQRDIQRCPSLRLRHSSFRPAHDVQPPKLRARLAQQRSALPLRLHCRLSAQREEKIGRSLHALSPGESLAESLRSP
jgi:hypothetical protein